MPSSREESTAELDSMNHSQISISVTSVTADSTCRLSLCLYKHDSMTTYSDGVERSVVGALYVYPNLFLLLDVDISYEYCCCS